jgi:hypothetical protein
MLVELKILQPQKLFKNEKDIPRFAVGGNTNRGGSP